MAKPPDWRKGDEEQGGTSRVFRQSVTVEIVWLAEGDDNGFRDWEAVVRESVMAHDPPANPGVATVTDVEELLPARAGSDEEER